MNSNIRGCVYWKQWLSDPDSSLLVADHFFVKYWCLPVDQNNVLGNKSVCAFHHL
jgi:hypothetical protein